MTHGAAQLPDRKDEEGRCSVTRRLYSAYSGQRGRCPCDGRGGSRTDEAVCLIRQTGRSMFFYVIFRDCCQKQETEQRVCLWSVRARGTKVLL